MKNSLKFARFFIIILFLFFTIPAALKPPTQNKSYDRCGQTAGVVRMYCQDSSLFFLKSPQVHFGHRPFNLEFSAIEWLQGNLVSLFEGRTCNGVEAVVKTTSVLFSALTIYFLFEVAALLFSPLTGLFASFLLSTNELWLRYSSYSMVENRALCFGVIGLYFLIRKKKSILFSTIFFALTFLQKPQIYFFMISFAGGVALFLQKNTPKELKKMIAIPLFSGVVGLTYLGYSMSVNQHSDLPWISWLGPRHLHWFLGNFSDRISLEFVKGLFFHWFHRCGIALILFFILLQTLITQKKPTTTILSLIGLRSLPFLLGTFVLELIFYPVFKAHEYYALPLSVGSALSMSAVLCIPLQNSKWNRFKNYFAALCVLFISIQGGSKYLEPPTYSKNWNKKIFPDSQVSPPSLVVIASPDSQRDTLRLYEAKRNGFQWCAKNEKFAPRQFWKDEGVTHVAWPTSVSKDGEIFWKVHTIDEELAHARKMGWSADGTTDVWKEKTMESWAKIASLLDLDPCRSESMHDPRSWPNP